MPGSLKTAADVVALSEERIADAVVEVAVLDLPAAVEQ